MEQGRERLVKPVLYLFGDDEQGIWDEAQMLAARARRALVLEGAEVGRAEEALWGTEMFGAPPDLVIVKTMQGVDAKAAGRWLQLCERLEPGVRRLVLCAPGVDVRKAWHKKLIAHPHVEARAMPQPSAEDTERWLNQLLAESGVKLAPEAVAWLAERARGMRAALRAFVERARLAGGDQAPLGLSEVAALFGERAPMQLSEWVDAVAMRRPEALAQTARLLREGVPAVQMIAWLGMRLEQMLLVAWHQAQHAADPLKAAGVPYPARGVIKQALSRWRASELVDLIVQLEEAETAIKSGGEALGALVPLVQRAVGAPHAA
ncbi:MAG: hypothetical protein D6771_04965 [Zetaproteobacteria bacterium]|nr:MAG: hypothetical protein D6771_04965 [Zetaproteobacteria bacterium]